MDRKAPSKAAVLNSGKMVTYGCRLDIWFKLIKKINLENIAGF